MLINSDRLGELEITEDSIVDFPQGILGFPDSHRFVILGADEAGYYSWIQSVEDSALTFLAVIPTPFFPSFDPEIPDEDCISIGLSDPDDGQVLCLLTAADSEITANLLGPIVLNVRTRLAKQVVLADPELSTRVPLVRA